jgi:glyceraldehyde 3-phosphate dehydrogenase
MENELFQDFDTTLDAWREQEKTTLELMQVVGELRFDKSIELVLFRRNIYDARPSEVINNHLFAKNYATQPISVYISLQIARAIAKLDIMPARIDIGKLAIQWVERKTDYFNINAFVAEHLAHFVGKDKLDLQPKDIVLYGFGRIGRIAARRLIEDTGRGEQLRLRAIVIRAQMKDHALELEKRAALLREDSVHGKFRGTVAVDAVTEELIINGNRVKIIFAGHPSEIDYTQYGINDAMIIDNTGVWRTKEELSQHLRPGIDQVLFTAPGKGIPNIVYGVNHETMDVENERIVCAASCTTNAIAPILMVLEDSFGINRGHIETVHAYTNDQNLLDNFHKKERRGRAAALNLVITSTGAAEAVTKVLPNLVGKLTGNAIRVPTPNVSLAILNMNIKRKTTLEEVNKVLRVASLEGALVEQIMYSNSSELVSSDCVSSVAACVYDAPATILSEDGENVTLYCWYDNEFGYTCQVLRLAKHIAKVRRLQYY